MGKGGPVPVCYDLLWTHRVRGCPILQWDHRPDSSIHTNEAPKQLTNTGWINAFLIFQLDVLFGNLTEMVEFQVEFLKTLEDGVRLVPDLEKLERVDQFKVSLNHR